MKNERHGQLQTITLDSMEDAVEHAKKAVEKYRGADEDPYSIDTRTNMVNRYTETSSYRYEWTKTHNMEEAYELAEQGWVDGLTEAMPIAQDAVRTIEDQIETIEMNPIWDVTGAEVDVGRFVQGVPENMVDYELTKVSKVGKVITLCSSVSVSSAVSAKSIMKRGAAVTALALALEKSGHATELWADFTISESSYHEDGKRLRLRVLVKGTNDVVDPERIAFAYAHPAMLRRLLFLNTVWTDDDILTAINGTMLGYPASPDKSSDLPEGTIYLPQIKSASDVEDPTSFVYNTLEDLGLTTERSHA